jgi:hypothetical protein
MGQRLVASVTVAVLWHDGDVTQGTNATDVLNKLCGGWNPNTVLELRSVFAKRALCNELIEHLTDDEFLQLLDAKGVLTYQVIQ